MGGDLAARARGAAWLLVRADLCGDVPAAWLRERFPGRLIYALRTRASGGDADPSDPGRGGRLAEAAGAFDLVELEPQDLRPETLAAVPPPRRLVCWRGPGEGLRGLQDRLRWLTGAEAALYRLVVDAADVRDGLPPIELLHRARRSDLVAYADGEAGLWSRVASAALDAPMVFGTVEGDAAAEPGGPAVGRLVEDFGLPRVGPVRQLFGFAGDPAARSLSPRLHNAAYRASGLPALFLPFLVGEFDAFWSAIVASGALERLGLPLRGLTVAAPNKARSKAVAAVISPAARRSDSANLLAFRHGHWVADTTDPCGVLEPLARRGFAVAGRRAAVIGCGGSGRAIAAALSKAGARVVLANRGRARGEAASRLLGLPLVALKELSAAAVDILINATPVGRGGEPPPVDVGGLRPGCAVVDLVYAGDPTPLAERAGAAGALVIEGLEVLAVQAARQFTKMTGRPMPPGLAEGMLGLEHAPERNSRGVDRRHPILTPGA
ncbi:type I 3-dehydroquinate dehydratase [Aquisphaera giovannonii]|uniref:type I 3-dehydroquinate dehydratase n=1 Tax=Aquisphaera giovannonii TaxID=406548 RepID=UPI0011E01C0F|nr:type I 3-dehydroquinate dehydratase [Aquisphaera giovannonii]